MTSATETHSFQAEVDELLGLMVHSLYSHREVFLRELISNASDALDKLRLEALSNPELATAKRPAIRLEPEASRRVLRVVDSGIGMSREEVVENLGTIARSGTRRFLERMRESGQSAGENLIGQFGVGFYASFMVADRIVVETARAGETTGTRWSSDGKGEFSIEDLERPPRGTSIELHLKPISADAGDDADAAMDFTDPKVLHGLVRRYSDFVEWPIEMAAAVFGEDSGLKQETADDGVEVVVLNSQKPLWSRPKDEIEPEDYKAFYKHVAHVWDEPRETIHFKAEGTTEYTALLFIPSERPMNLFEATAERSNVSLYVRHVFVMSECEELVPPWLRFVRGVVDSQDLPLNVSREILQQNRTMSQIRGRVVKKVLGALETMQRERREDYEAFWSAFGGVLKEGIVTDPEQAEALAALCLFESSRGEGPTTLDEYLERLGEEDAGILCLAAADREAAERSPHVEGYRAREREVLYFTDPVDEWVLDRLREFKEHKLVRIDRGSAFPGGAVQSEEIESKEREQRALLEALEARLAGRVEKVRFSGRLVESPAALVDEEGSLGPQLEAMMRQAGQVPPARKRALELNPGHPVVERLAELVRADASQERVEDFAELLLGQALLAEGSPLGDPQRFAKLINDLILSAE